MKTRKSAPEPRTEENRLPEIPRKIFEEFLSELPTIGASEEMIARFRKTLVEDVDLSAEGVKTALFTEE